MIVKRRYERASSRIAKRNQTRKSFSIFLKTSVPALLLIGLGFLLRADFLQIKTFNVSGSETLSAENVKNTASDFVSGQRFLFIPKSNIFLLSKDALAAAILKNFPRLEKVSVNKQFFGESVQLSLVERKADFLWCTLLTECFFMSRDGLVFERATDAQNFTNKLKFGGLIEGDPIMKSFATEAEMQNYLRLADILSQAGFKVTFINVESKDRAMAQTEMGDIIFDPDESDLSVVAQNVTLLIKEEKNKNSSVHFQYIDARFGNKIFYKPR